MGRVGWFRMSIEKQDNLLKMLILAICCILGKYLGFMYFSQALNRTSFK